MREKVLYLIYLDTQRYISLDNLRAFYWGIMIIPFYMMVMGTVSIYTTGVSWKSMFPLVSFAIWSLFYWIFVFTLQSKRTKKNFELRFLVNGISGLFVSSLTWILFVSFNLTSDTPFLSSDFFLWMLLFYLLFSLIYVFAIILCVHKGVFALIKKKSKTKTALMVSVFFGTVISSSGVIGLYTSRVIRAHVSISIQLLIVTILVILLVFLFALAHINFVQFYYCKKYGINCDEHGNTTSPELERKPMKKRVLRGKKETLQERTKITTIVFAKTDSSNNIPSKKQIPVIIKILIGIVSVPAIIFIFVFIVFFIKGFMQGIS